MMPNSLFYYPRELCRALEGMGYRVALANDEYPQNPLGKAIGKLDLTLSRWWTRRTVNRRFLSGRQWDLVLIIKGRGVGPELIRDLRRHSRRIVGYHYDALDYDRSTRRWSNLVDRISTFDPRDADQQGWDLVELFAACEPPPGSPEKRYLFSAILRNHSNRLIYVDRIARLLPGASTFVYFYEKDLLTLVVNFLRHPLIYWKWRQHIHSTPLAYEKFVEVVAASEFTIDYAHPRQTGCTMRSAEAQALGAKLITNKPRLGPNGGPASPGTLHCPDDFPAGRLPEQVARLTGTYPAKVERSVERFLAEVIGAEETEAR